MRKIYVCSVYASKGDKYENRKKATLYCSHIINQGDCPVAPHVFYTTMLDDSIKEQRAAGLLIGTELLKHCDELQVWSDISGAMVDEIRYAVENDIEVSVGALHEIDRENGIQREMEIYEQLQEVLNGKEHNSD